MARSAPISETEDPLSDAQRPFDLLVTAGRVFCADTRLDGPGAVAIRGDRIVAAGPEVAGAAVRTLEYPEALLLPGLVDMHAHPARGGSRYGVDPDEHFLPRGTTTCLSQGDAGALNWPAYRDDVIGTCQTRVRLALHLSKYGEFAGGTLFRAPRERRRRSVCRGGDLGGRGDLGYRLQHHAKPGDRPRPEM